MTIEMNLFPSTVGGAGETGAAGSARAAGAPPDAVADGDAAPGSAEACFAALVAWLMQVAPAETRADAAAGAPGERPAAGFQTIARSAAGPVHAAPATSAAPDASAGTAGDALLARAVFSIASAEIGTPAEAAGVPSQPTQGSESSARALGPLDLSFLGAAPAESAPARELPAPSPGAASAEPRAQFAAELGHRVVTMVEQGVNDARLRVHPEHLGPIEIRVRLDGDSAQVTFHSAHGAVRDALADAVPRLRELLADAGFGLDHVDIGAGDPQGFGASGDDARGASVADLAAGEAGADTPAEAGEPERRVAITHGLVDTFA